MRLETQKAPMSLAVSWRLMALGLLYIAIVSTIAESYASEADLSLVDDRPVSAREHFDQASARPSLARWDSYWFHGIAVDGYRRGTPEGRHAAGFLPLYPLLMAVFSRLFRVKPLVAGIWVSRVAFLGSIFLFVDYLNLRKVPMRRALPILFLLITFPSAYILVSAYTESLFLVSALAVFVSVLREKPALAAVAAFLAGLTRIHAIALFPALLVYGWCDSASRRRFLRPVLAPLSGLVMSALCISLFYYYIYEDPFMYLTAKREGWSTEPASPLVMIGNVIRSLDSAISQHNLGSLSTYYELIAFEFVIIASIDLIHRGLAPEATYVLSGLLISVASGSLWGLPRFTLVLFPVFLIGQRIRRLPLLYISTIMINSMLQTCLLINYVAFRGPAP